LDTRRLPGNCRHTDLETSTFGERADGKYLDFSRLQKQQCLPGEEDPAGIV